MLEGCLLSTVMVYCAMVVAGRINRSVKMAIMVCLILMSVLFMSDNLINNINSWCKFSENSQIIAIFANKFKCIYESNQPQDIADTILFLASEQAQMLTGQVIKVSGGHAF